MKSKDIIAKQVFCESCMKDFSLSPIRQMLETKPILCDDCLSAVTGNLHVASYFGMRILFLSRYQGLMRKWLLDYKENLDVELAPCFLYPFLPLIRFLYSDCLFVPVPSHRKKIEERGFDHLPLMLDRSGLPHQELLEKDNALEVKEMTHLERVHQKRGIHPKPEMKQDLSQKEIVLFDDVFTTGNTFRDALSAVKKLHPKKIHGLILMDNYGLEKMKVQGIYLFNKINSL